MIFFVGVYVFEMIGFSVEGEGTQRTPTRIPMAFDPPSTGNFIGVMCDVNSAGMGDGFERASEKYAGGLKYYVTNVAGMVPDAYRSDHGPYWLDGRRGVMITDTANFRNPHYHQKSDVVETLNFEFMGNVVKGMVGTLGEYGGVVLVE